MKRVLFFAVAVMAALFGSWATADETSPSKADRRADDLSTAESLAIVMYDTPWFLERRIKIWYKLYKVYGARWRAAMLIKEACGEDVPAGILVTKEEEDEKIVTFLHQLYPKDKDDFLNTMVILAAVNSLMLGYELGYREAISLHTGSSRRTLCRLGRDLAHEILLEDDFLRPSPDTK